MQLLFLIGHSSIVGIFNAKTHILAGPLSTSLFNFIYKMMIYSIKIRNINLIGERKLKLLNDRNLFNSIPVGHFQIWF